MALNNNQKTSILVFSAAFMTYWLFIRQRINPKSNPEKKADKLSMDGFTEKDDPIKRKTIKAPVINPRELSNPKIANAFNVMKAYIAAYNAGEKLSDLREMSEEMRRKFGMNVYQKPDGRVAVSDYTGQDIIVND